MPAFSAASRAKLATADARLVRVFEAVGRRVDCTILEGERGREAQEAAFADGKSKLHYPHGKHNAHPSRAVDAAPYPVDWSGTPRNFERFALFAGFVLGVAEAQGVRLRWGGDWDGDWSTVDEKFRDMVHFELIDP